MAAPAKSFAALLAALLLACAAAPAHARLFGVLGYGVCQTGCNTVAGMLRCRMAACAAVALSPL
jgi:hypothetical protein